MGILAYRRRRARGSLGSELPGVRDGVCKLAAAAPLVALPNRAQKGDKEEDLLQSLALFFFARGRGLATMMAVAKRPEAEWQEYWRTLEAQGWLMVKHGEKQRGPRAPLLRIAFCVLTAL